MTSTSIIRQFRTKLYALMDYRLLLVESRDCDPGEIEILDARISALGNRIDAAKKGIRRVPLVRSIA